MKDLAEVAEPGGEGIAYEVLLEWKGEARIREPETGVVRWVPSSLLLPLHRTEATVGVSCSTCDGGGCPDCTDA